MITYFAQGVDGGPIKIGRTKSLVSRRSTLSTSRPDGVIMLAYVDGDREAELHSLFRDFRIRREWFEDSEMLVSWMHCNAHILPRNTRRLSLPGFISKSLTSELCDDFVVLGKCAGLADWLSSKLLNALTIINGYFVETHPECAYGPDEQPREAIKQVLSIVANKIRGCPKVSEVGVRGTSIVVSMPEVRTTRQHGALDELRIAAWDLDLIYCFMLVIVGGHAFIDPRLMVNIPTECIVVGDGELDDACHSHRVHYFTKEALKDFPVIRKAHREF